MSPVKLRHLHYRHGAYYYVRRQGGKVVWRRLSADRSEAIRLWETLERVAPSESRSVAAALDRYLQHRAAELAPATLDLYAICRRRLEEVPRLLIGDDQPSRCRTHAGSIGGRPGKSALAPFASRLGGQVALLVLRSAHCWPLGAQPMTCLLVSGSLLNYRRTLR